MMDFCPGGFIVNRALVSVLILGLAACGGGTDGPPTGPSEDVDVVVLDLVVGEGPIAEVGDTVTVNYVGRLLDGTQFDSSYDRGVPFTFTAGLGQVIRGWDEGVPGMRVGGTRRLTIPHQLAYGGNPPAGSGIPANASLTFDIELLAIAGK
jgi:FKBP-type peptidyl-prolyl cis-trans isomerase